MPVSTTLGMIEGQAILAKARVHRKRENVRHEPKEVNGGCREHRRLARTMAFVLRAQMSGKEGSHLARFMLERGRSTEK